MLIAHIGNSGEVSKPKPKDFYTLCILLIFREQIEIHCFAMQYCAWAFLSTNGPSMSGYPLSNPLQNKMCMLMLHTDPEKMTVMLDSPGCRGGHL